MNFKLEINHEIQVKDVQQASTELIVSIQNRSKLPDQMDFSLTDIISFLMKGSIAPESTGLIISAYRKRIKDLNS